MATAKIKFLKDIACAGIKKGDVKSFEIPAVLENLWGQGINKIYDPDCMDEIAEFMELAMAVELEKRGIPRVDGNYPAMFYLNDDLDNEQVDHTGNPLIENETFFVMNIGELHDDLMDERDEYEDEDEDEDEIEV